MTLEFKLINLKKLTSLICIIVFNLGLFNSLSAENNLETLKKNQLEAIPQRCVALREGQTCYQNVVFKWQAKKRLEYCLFIDEEKSPINCWPASTSGQFKIDFQSSKSKRFFLRVKDSQVDIESTEVIVAWVYGNKKRRRASWRLF